MVLARKFALLCLIAAVSITTHLTLLERQHPVSIAVMEVELFDDAPRIITLASQVSNIEEVEIPGQCDDIHSVGGHAVGGKFENGLGGCQVCKVRSASTVIEERGNRGEGAWTGV